jgi:hypothetical protein
MGTLSKNLADIVRYIKPGVAQPDPHPNLDLARQLNRVWPWAGDWGSGVGDPTPGLFRVIVA